MKTDDLEKFLSFLTLKPGTSALQSVALDQNLNGRVFGGQLLAHAARAALAQAPEQHLSSLRLGFLQGALADTPIDWSVVPLQQGNRFSNYHLRATQGSRCIADAQVTLQTPVTGFEHSGPLPDALPMPESLPTLTELESRILDATGRGYDLQSRSFLDIRLLDADNFLFQPSAQPVLRYWVKARPQLPDDPAVHTAALAYISDFWFNYAAIAPHFAITGSRDRVYVASLNHNLWQYLPCRADEWLLFDVMSPRASDGRILSWGRVFTQDGRMVAAVSQEGVATLRN